MEANLKNIDKLNGFVPVLDGVRGYAIIMVLSIHSIQYSRIIGYDYDVFREIVYKISSFGWLGVDLFFVLSGFLITGILINSKNKNNCIKNFYIKRVLRIFPLYFLYITIVLFFVPLFVDYFNEDYYSSVPFGKHIFYFYMQNFLVPGGDTLPHMLLDPMWSLAIEEHFYIVWPFIVLLLSNRKLILFCVVTIMSVVCLRYYLHEVLRILGDWIGRWTITRIDSILVGSLLALMIRDEIVSYYLNKNRHILVLVMGISVVLLGFKDNVFSACYSYTIFSLFFAAVINFIMFSKMDSKISKVFNNKFIAMLGKHSYAIYIINMPIVCLVYTYILGDNYKTMYFGMIIMFVLTCIISLIVSVLIWHLYEKHFLGLKEKFNN